MTWSRRRRKKVWYGGGYIWWWWWWCRQQHERDNPYGDWPPWLTLMISKSRVEIVTFLISITINACDTLKQFKPPIGLAWRRCEGHTHTIQYMYSGVFDHMGPNDTHFALINFICWWSAHWSRNRRLSTISAVLWILVYLIIWGAYRHHSEYSLLCLLQVSIKSAEY